MALHGEIKVNGNEIGKWEAVRVGKADDDFIYRCRVEYTNTSGYGYLRVFFVRHNYNDGALLLTSRVTERAAFEMGQRQMSETVAWDNFCDAHN